MTAIEPGIFKAYDIRGLYPSQLDAEVARRVGRAFVDYLGARRIAVGRDCRLVLARALGRASWRAPDRRARR